MAEGDVTFYNDFKEQLQKGTHILDSHTIKVTLHTGYTPNIDTHAVWADVSATEIGAGNGYTSGGKTLTVTVAQDNTNDRASFDATDLTWTSLNVGTPSHAIIWNDTPTSPADPLIGYIELGTTASNGGDYTLAFNANGIGLLT